KPAAKTAKAGMSTSTKAWIVIAVAVAFAAGLIFWQLKAKGINPNNISAEDMTLLAEQLSPQDRAQLATDEKARKEYATQIRQLLSVAAEARNAGYADKPEIKQQLQLMRSLIIAETYEREQQEKRGPSPTFADIKQEEVDAFLKEP